MFIVYINTTDKETTIKISNGMQTVCLCYTNNYCLF